MPQISRRIRSTLNLITHPSESSLTSIIAYQTPPRVCNLRRILYYIRRIRLVVDLSVTRWGQPYHSMRPFSHPFENPCPVKMALLSAHFTPNKIPFGDTISRRLWRGEKRLYALITRFSATFHEISEMFDCGLYCVHYPCM
jgi:hypothetical protein